MGGIEFKKAGDYSTLEMQRKKPRNWRQGLLKSIYCQFTLLPRIGSLLFDICVLVLVSCRRVIFITYVYDYGKCLERIQNKRKFYFIPSLPLIYTHFVKYVRKESCTEITTSANGPSFSSFILSINQFFQQKHVSSFLYVGTRDRMLEFKCHVYCFCRRSWRR